MFLLFVLLLVQLLIHYLNESVTNDKEEDDPFSCPLYCGGYKTLTMIVMTDMLLKNVNFQTIIKIVVVHN